jgi:hypothetical protein
VSVLQRHLSCSSARPVCIAVVSTSSLHRVAST